MKLPSAQDLHFDIDEYLNPLIPRPRIYRLPKLVARFLGYRKEPVKEVGNLVIAWWAFIGAFAGLCLVAGVFNYGPAVVSLHPPILIASFGATAVLEYNVIQSPLAQPRNSLVGHVLSAVIGVAITKLFMLNSYFESTTWFVGAFACGIASAAMGLTHTVHPPGGATALLAAVDPIARGMGWKFVLLILLGSVLMLLAGLLLNNIQRQFPVCWWTPKEVGKRRHPDIEEQTPKEEEDLEKYLSNRPEFEEHHAIMITEDSIRLPHGITLGPEEREMVAILRDRLRSLYPETRSNGSISTGTTDVELQRNDSHETSKAVDDK